MSCLPAPQNRHPPPPVTHQQPRWHLSEQPKYFDRSPAVDGLIYASSMVILDSARRKAPVPALARWLLGPGIAATLAANVAHGLNHGPVGAAVAAWSAVALVGSYELLIVVIRSSQLSTVTRPEGERTADPLQEQAAEVVFAEHLAADKVPSARAIRAQLHVGQPRAQRLRDYLPSQRHRTGRTGLNSTIRQLFAKAGAVYQRSTWMT
jgi:hypothetical protein